MDLIKKTNIDFVSKRNAFFISSIVVTIVGLILVGILGVDYGIDFTGGTQVAIGFERPTVSPEEIRSSMSSIGYDNAEIKAYGGQGQYLIRVQESGEGTAVANQLVTTLQTKFSDNTVVLLQSEKIDAKVSSELAWDSTLALVAAFAMILVYVAFRFEFAYGLGAIVALLHDVLMAFALTVLMNKLGILNLETNINSIAAYLTILGYSINDKVVVFDRLRENRELHKNLSLKDLINLSLNETLSRTIITGISVLVALLVLMLFGGEVLEGFAFTMFIGIVVGTYSSIYIAASFVLWYSERTGTKNLGSASVAKA